MRKAIVLLLALAAVPLFAQVTFDPPDPTAATPVTLKLRTTWPDSCVPGDPQGSRSGNQLTVTWSTDPNQACRAAITPFASDVGIGTLPAGTYNVTLRVQKGTSLINVATTTLFVRDANPVFRVRPSIVSSTATTPAFIIGIRNPNPLCAPASAQISVTVDGEAVPILQRAGCHLIVSLPPNEPEAATVRVTINGVVHEVLGAVNYVDPAAAPDPALYERILIPVLMEGPGAFGSQWTTEAVMINAGGDIIEGVHDVAKAMPVLTSGQQSPNLLSFFGNRPEGVVLFVPRGQDVRFGSLVRDVSRDASQWGTEVPVARERDAQQVIELPNVPFDNRYRLNLRIYGLDGVAFRVRVHVGRETREVLVAGPCTAAPCNSNRPAYASVDLRALFPNAEAKETVAIVSLDHARAAWAFVSVTNNQTQHVTVISPQ